MPAKSGKGTAKTKKAPPDMAEMVETLLKMAAGAPARTLLEEATEAKLYEIVVLAEVLGAYPGQVRAVSPGGATVFKLAGSPSKATKGTFTYFEMVNAAGTVEHEVWLSAEVKTLSWDRSGAMGTALSSQHEIDVGVFSAPLPASSYPTHQQLDAGLSCKHMATSKVHVRELLGLRRETALLARPQPCRAAWLGKLQVPANPSSPVYLVSSDPGVLEYESPIDELGVYLAYVPFP
jgi:hypothetical protein